MGDTFFEYIDKKRLQEKKDNELKALQHKEENKENLAIGDTFFEYIDKRRLQEKLDNELKTLQHKEKKKEEKKKKLQAIQNLVLPVNKDDKIKWKYKPEIFTKFEGYYEDKLIFEIKKGITIFTLTVKDKELRKKFSIKSSVDIRPLMEKAEKFLNDNIS